MVNYSSNALCWIIFANICIFSSNILFRTHALLFINKTDLYFQWGFQVVLVVKNLLANAGNSREVRWIPGMGRSPGEANDNPPQCSCQGNPMARGVWRATVLGIAKNWTWFSVHVRARTHTHTHTHTHTQTFNIYQALISRLYSFYNNNLKVSRFFLFPICPRNSSNHIEITYSISFDKILLWNC